MNIKLSAIVLISLFPFLLLDCAAKNKPEYNWTAFHTAVKTKDRKGTEVLRISPRKANETVLVLKRTLLGKIFDKEKNLYAFTADTSGRLFKEIVDNSGEYTSKRIPLPFSADDLELAAATWIERDRLAAVFAGESGISLLITNKNGALIDRQILPDFLMGPDTDYKLGETDLHNCRITEIDNSHRRLLVLKGTAELFPGQPQKWIVSYRPGEEGFLESKVLGKQKKSPDDSNPE
jgi:hypothetical protein